MDIKKKVGKIQAEKLAFTDKRSTAKFSIIKSN